MNKKGRKPFILETRGIAALSTEARDMEHPAITAWLDEIEMYGLRRERVPDGAMPWIIEAFLRGQDAEREACAKIAENWLGSDRLAAVSHKPGAEAGIKLVRAEAQHIAAAIRNRT